MAGVLIALALVVVVYTRLLDVTHPTIAALSFLLIVFGAAAWSTLRVAVLASLTATACFNYFFLPPTGTWNVADPENWFALFTLLLVSVLVSRLAAKARSRAQEAVARRDEMARLFDFTRDILLTAEAPDPIAAIAQLVGRRFGLSRVSIFRRNHGAWSEHTVATPFQIEAPTLDKALDGAEVVADRVWLVPLRLGTAAVGLLALEGESLEAGARDAIAGVTAIAIERQQLLDERRDAEVVRQSSELRSTLIASLSHDLRTTLTALTVASDNLGTESISAADRDDQVEVIRSESRRLKRLFENIVDMARIETRAITPEPRWVQPGEIIEAARLHVGAQLRTHRVVTDVDEGAAVQVDPRLISAAVAHLLENAAQYSAPNSTIDVDAAIDGLELRISIRDRGPGIAAADLDHVFDRSYRGVAGKERFGTGMGLAVTRGLLAAHGGRVWAENDPDGGARLTLAVPAKSRPVVRTEEAE